MNGSLRLGDRLAPPRNHEAYLEVLDATPRGGSVKVFDSAQQTDRYIKLEWINEQIYLGKLALLRAGKPLHSLAAQPDDVELQERSKFAREIMGRIKAIQKQRGVSFRRAYQLLSDEYVKNGKR
jgi:putative transposase